jgi:hypothetical protein
MAVLGAELEPEMEVEVEAEARRPSSGEESGDGPL